MKKILYILPILAITLIASTALATEYPVYTVTTHFTKDTGYGSCSFGNFGDCAMTPNPLAVDVGYAFHLTSIHVSEITTPNSGNNNAGTGYFKAYIFNSSTPTEGNVIASSSNISGEWSDALNTYYNPTTFTFGNGITIHDGQIFYLGFGSVSNLQMGALMTITSSTIFGNIGTFEFQQPTSSIPRADFSNWLIGSQLTGVSAYPYSEFCVEYSKTSSSTFPFRDCIYHGSLPETNEGQTAILKTKELELGTWWAKASAYAIDENNNHIWLISTPVLEFTIDNPLSPDSLYFQYLKDKLRIEIQDCSQYSGGFFTSSTINGMVCGVQNAWANIVNFVLATIDNITTSLGKLFQATFPINIFAHINRDFTEARKASSTANIIFNEESNPDIFGGRTYTFLSSTTMATAQSKVNFDYRTILNYIMYALTGAVMLYYSVRVVGHLVQDKQQKL